MSYRNQIIPDDVNVREYSTTYLSETNDEGECQANYDFNKEDEIVNNYEVNLILESYLVIWNRDTSKNHILLADLLSEFDKIYYNLITQIFKEEEVYYDEYFESFSILLFCNFNQITSYLLTMMNINSNIMINEEQIDRVLDVFDRQYINVYDFKESSKNKIYLNDSDAYSIKLFIPWLISCLGFQSLIFGVRNAIVELTLGTSSFNNITKRVNHYYGVIKTNIMKNDGNTSFMYNKLIATQLPPLSPKSLTSNPSTATNSFFITSNSNSPDKILNYSNNGNCNNLKLIPSKPPVMPKEPCLSKVKRIVFSNEPPQYYYDYYLMYPSINSVNDLILELRSGKGYGMRNRSSTNVSKRNCFRSKVKTTCICSSNKKSNLNPDNKGNTANIRITKRDRVKSCNFSDPPSSIKMTLVDTPNTVHVMPRRFDMTKMKNKSEIKCENIKKADKNIVEPNRPTDKLQIQYSF